MKITSDVNFDNYFKKTKSKNHLVKDFILQMFSYKKRSKFCNQVLLFIYDVVCDPEKMVKQKKNSFKAKFTIASFKLHDTWNKIFKNGPSKNCRRQPLKNLKEYGLPADHVSLQILRLSSANFTLSILEYFVP